MTFFFWAHLDKLHFDIIFSSCLVLLNFPQSESWLVAFVQHFDVVISLTVALLLLFLHACQQHSYVQRSAASICWSSHEAFCGMPWDLYRTPGCGTTASFYTPRRINCYVISVQRIDKVLACDIDGCCYCIPTFVEKGSGNQILFRLRLLEILGICSGEMRLLQSLKVNTEAGVGSTRC